MNEIDQIVEHKKTGSQINWDLFKNQNVYTLEVWVKVGRQSKRIESSDLGLDDDLIAELKALTVGGYAAKFGRQIKDASTKLQSMQKLFYSRFTAFSHPFRFVAEADIAKALDAIEDIRATAEELKQELVDNYEDGLKDFLGNIKSLLDKTKLSAKDKNNALQRYSQVYPSPMDIKDKYFQIVVEGPVKIRSIADQIKQDAEYAQKEKELLQAELEAQRIKAKKNLEKAEAEAKIRQLEKEAEEKERRSEAIQKSQQGYLESLSAAFFQAQINSRDETYNMLADLIDRYSVLKPGEVNVKVEKAWENVFGRMHTLAEYDTALKPIVETADALRQKLLNKSEDTIDETEIGQELEEFHADVRSFIADDNTGEGHERLTKYLTQENEYRELISSLESISDKDDYDKLQEIQSRCESIKNMYRFRQKAIEEHLEKAKRAVRISMGLETEKRKRKPAFDENAGF